MTETGIEPRPTAVRGGRQRSRARSVAWSVAALLAVAYGSFWIASAASLSERQRVADLGELSARDAAALSDPQAGRLAEAVRTVEGARRSTLGLWPRYDGDALDAAARVLAEVVAEASPETSASQEARLALGRVLVLRERDAEAARVLGSLVRQGGYRAPEARRLLDWIRTAADPIAEGPRTVGPRQRQ